MESQAVDDSRKWIRIGTAAQRAGMSVKTVRFYSDEGLIPIAGRTKGGYRLYHQHVVEELHLIQNLRGLGLPLVTISRYLATKREGACHCEQLKQSMREQQQAIHQKNCRSAEASERTGRNHGGLGALRRPFRRQTDVRTVLGALDFDSQP